jgi:hypothetical protein
MTAYSHLDHYSQYTAKIREVALQQLQKTSRHRLHKIVLTGIRLKVDRRSDLCTRQPDNMALYLPYMRE